MLPLSLQSGISLIISCGLVTASCAQTTRWEMKTHSIEDTFDTGELSAWETYPFFQDMGFNPTLSCTHEPKADGIYSLSQTFKPTDTDYPFDLNPVGLMKRLHITTSVDSRLKLAVFISSDRRPQTLEISLCSEDGKLFLNTESSPKVNEWIRIDLPISAFHSGETALTPDTPIEAITVVAEFDMVSPDRSYALNIDSFSLTGKRRSRLIPTTSQATWFEHFQKAALNHHYSPGDKLSIAVKPEDLENENKLQSVLCSVIDPEGKSVVSDIECSNREETGGGIWTNTNVYEFSRSDSPGRWHIRLVGRTGQGTTVESDYHFLVTRDPFSTAQHPRLLFSSDDIRNRAALRERSPFLQELYKEVTTQAREKLAEESVARHPEFRSVNPEFLGGGLFSPGWDQFDEWINGLDASILAEECALLYALDGDTTMGGRGKDFLLHVCNFKAWNHPWMESRGIHMYYPVGYTACRVAVAYDLLYQLLSEEEKGVVKGALLRNAIIPAYRGEVLDNHIPSNISNHLGVSCTGALLSAVVLLGEDPDNPFMEPYLSGILTKFEAHLDAGYLRDGSYAESSSYFHMDSDMTVKALACLLRNFGIDWTASKGVDKAWLYPVYASTVDGTGCLDMGDGSDTWGNHGTKPLLWAAHHLRDGLAWDRYLWTHGPDIQNKQKSDFDDYLWAPVDLQPVPLSTLPPSKWFPAKGFACFRSGWGQEDLQLLYKAGPHSNHHHLDQGNLLLRYGGETLLDEGGYADYYLNGYYHSFYEQAVAHNTVLVNWYPESQGLGDLRNQVKALQRYPVISECSTGKIIDALDSELSSVYMGRLDRFERSILFAKPDYIILHDRIKPGTTSSLQWLFHAKNKDSILPASRTCTINRHNASLRMEILSPPTFTTKVKGHPDSEKGVLMISSPTTSEEVTFLSVLIPSREGDRDERINWQVSSIDEEGWTGARIVRGTEVDEIYFRKNRQDNSRTGLYHTDADRLLLSKANDGDLTRLWLQQATTFELPPNSGNAALQITAEPAGTFALRWQDSILEIESDPGCDLNLGLTGIDRPSKVSWNGLEQSFEFDPTRKNLQVQITSEDGKLQSSQP